MAPRESVLQWMGRLLDRSVHDTIRRFFPMVVPFVIVDFLGNIMPGASSLTYVVSLAVASLFENRARALSIDAMKRSDGARLEWRAILRSPASLWFAIPSAFDFVPAFTIIGMFALPFSVFARIHSGFVPVSGLIGMIAVSVVFLALGIVVFFVSALFLLACAAAMMDVAADGASAGMAFKRWLRRCFRMRTIVSTMTVAFLYVLFFVGVTLLFSGLPFSSWQHAMLVSIPDGIADTLGFLIIWNWRLDVLNRDEGRDFAVAHDALGSLSQTVSAPGSL